MTAENQYKQLAGVCNKETDEAYTPFYAVDPLLKYIPKTMKIWCPFDKEWSAYVQKFKEEGKDFFEYEPEEYDIIISNPPFSLTDEVLKRLYELGKPFVMLMPLKYLQSKKRGDMFFENGIQLLSFDIRIDYHRMQDFQKTTPGNNQASSYFCWKILPRDLIIEKLERYQKPLISSQNTVKEKLK